MSEVLQKAISANGEAVIYALDATAIVQETMQRVGCWPPATKHLGQAMMASLLLQALSDSDSNDTLSLQWSCEGPFGHLFAEARNFGEVRGTIQRPRPDVSDYETPLGPGLLQVRRSQGSLGTTSIVNSTGLVSADIVEYLEKSEQKNCGINLSVIVDWGDDSRASFRVVSALAYLIHILPQPTEAKLNEALVRWDRQMAALGSISRWLLREGKVTEDMIRIISGEEEPGIVMTQRVAFRCNCSESRAARALALLKAQEEKEGTIHEAEATEIRCEYCGITYTIQEGRSGPVLAGKSRTKKPAKAKRKAAPAAKKKAAKKKKASAKPRKKPAPKRKKRKA